jgi:putative PEP-CTERM system histidine kinase
MNLDGMMAAAAAVFTSGLALAVLIGSGRGISARFFIAGMVLFAVESVFEGFSLATAVPDEIAAWQSWAWVVKSCLPGAWLCFSFSYSRGDGFEFLRKWKLVLLSATVLPLVFALYHRAHLIEVLHDSPDDWLRFTIPGRILDVFILLGTILILMNLEHTFRSAVGTTRWRIKFLVLGMAVIFGVRVYARSQLLLFSSYDLSLAGIESASLILGCGLILVGYFRSGFGKIELYPSRAVLRTSLTLLLVGGYLIVVGVLAQVVAYFGAAASFRLGAMIILLGAICLALLLFSDRAHRRVDLFVSRHLKRPRYDLRQVWSRFTKATGEAQDRATLSATLATLLSETFRALSVSIWLVDEDTGGLKLAASTAGTEIETDPRSSECRGEKPDAALLQSLKEPFDLDTARDPQVRSLRALDQKRFREGGHQICVPLRVRERCHGIAILSDRVKAVPYSVEEFDLLECIAEQSAARFANLEAASQLLARKELEALQHVTAFFVHDLKNAASTLKLMLTNLPAHFADPAFREDAVRGIRNTVARIDQLISRGGSLRAESELKVTECDVATLVAESLKDLNGAVGLELVQRLEPVPRVMADREQIQSVITNLLLNASEASGTSRVTVETGRLDGWVSIRVTDNGCGMSPTFIRESLFRPFQTTKKKGFGIGMFQSKVIVEAHRGRISVTSEPGVGTTFRVLIPAVSPAS